MFDGLAAIADLPPDDVSESISDQRWSQLVTGNVDAVPRRLSRSGTKSTLLRLPPLALHIVGAAIAVHSIPSALTIFSII